MKGNDIREAYLSFFETKKNHLRLKSFPLIPKDDPSLLLIGAGMAPLKPYFTGKVEPPCHRITTSQKCIRTGDIENVGHTARHHTFLKCWAISLLVIILKGSHHLGVGIFDGSDSFR